MYITLNRYQVRTLARILEDLEESDQTLTITEGDGHSGEGLYAGWTDSPELGSFFIGVDEEDQRRGDRMMELEIVVAPELDEPQ